MSEAVSSSKLENLLLSKQHASRKRDAVSKHVTVGSSGGGGDRGDGDIDNLKRPHDGHDKNGTNGRRAVLHQGKGEPNERHLSVDQDVVDAGPGRRSHSKRHSNHGHRRSGHHHRRRHRRRHRYPGHRHHHHNRHRNHHRDHPRAHTIQIIKLRPRSRLGKRVNSAAPEHVKHQAVQLSIDNWHQKAHMTNLPTLASSRTSERVKDEAEVVHRSNGEFNSTKLASFVGRSAPRPEVVDLSHSTGHKLLGHIMLIGLPLCFCLMLALMCLFVLKCIKCTRQTGKNKQRSAAKKNSNKMKKFSLFPVRLVSNGEKNLKIQSSDSSLKGGVTTMDNNESLRNSRPMKNEKRKALDCRQLTIDMDGMYMSTDDSDEQQSRKVAFATTGSKHKQTATKPGVLRYGLEYDFIQSILSVSVIEARDLPGLDLNGSSDPYVNVHMLNNKSLPAFKTKIHKRTLNPVFNETFKYHITYAELNKQTLILSVYDHDRLSKHDEIGQLTLPMSSIDLTKRQENWSELRKMNASVEGSLGEICLSLRYVPTAGRLNVVILEARQLKKMDVAGLSDPYVKLVLMRSGKRLKKKKTSIKKCTLNPHYNESFSFEVPFEHAQEVQLIITVVDYDRIGTSEPIGRITLGCEQATGETELRHWMDMLASPRRPIARWHALKNMEPETKQPARERRFSQFKINK
jgi:synaptotagmin-1